MKTSSTWKSQRADAERGVCEVQCHGQQLKIPYCDQPAGSRLFIGIRADDIVLARQRPEGLSVRNALQGTISAIADVGGKQLIYVDVGRRLAAKTTPEAIEEMQTRHRRPDLLPRQNPFHPLGTAARPGGQALTRQTLAFYTFYYR